MYTQICTPGQKTPLGKKESGIAATLGKFLLCEDWERPHVKLVTYAPP
jgi:hypothetical protein